MSETFADQIVVRIVVQSDGSVTVDSDDPAADLAGMLHRALECLPAAPTGRPYGSTYIPDIATVRRVYRAVCADGETPTKAAVAERLFVTPKTLRRFLRRLGAPWPPREDNKGHLGPTRDGNPVASRQDESTRADSNPR